MTTATEGADRVGDQDFVRVIDDDLGVNASIARSIAEPLARQASGGIPLPEGAQGLRHLIRDCLVEACPLCSVLLCPRGDYRHLTGCPHCTGTDDQARFMAVKLARRRAVAVMRERDKLREQLAAAEADLEHEHDERAQLVEAFRVPVDEQGGAALLVEARDALEAAGAVLVRVEAFLRGLSAGAAVAGREVAGIEAVIADVRSVLGLDAPATRPEAVPSDPGEPLPPQAVEAAKYLRAEAGCSLADALDALDRHDGDRVAALTYLRNEGNA